jgi:hypothetical protein
MPRPCHVLPPSNDARIPGTTFVPAKIPPNFETKKFETVPFVRKLGVQLSPWSEEALIVSEVALKIIPVGVVTRAETSVKRVEFGNFDQ